MTEIKRRPPRLTSEAWAHAREDFIAGVSAAVLAERYGTTERSIRRRAVIEGWRRPDGIPSRLGSPPPWMAMPRTREEEMEVDPALEEVDEEASTARFGLLFNPEPHSLRRYAFRQAAENAALDRPQQAVAWMRLVQLAERCGPQLRNDATAFRDIDYVRAAFLRSLNLAVAEGKAELEAEEAAASTAEDAAIEDAETAGSVETDLTSAPGAPAFAEAPG